MIQVSNEFKKAIKESERRIKGYVEVLYDLPSVTVTPSVNATSTYTPTSEISNGVRVENLYGSLDYLPLDGSYITMGDTNTNIGYISDELFENLTNPTITLSFGSTTINGITMYFRENSPTNMTLNYSDGTSQTIANEENIVQVIFDSPKTLTSVSITINDMMYQDRKVYIMEIDLGVTQVYKDQDLIEFTVDEEVNKLVEEVPINETNIILNNMSDLFNPLNPQGIVPYLSENTLIKPYIGVLTENQGVEYVKMGEFYFDSYTNNSDATTTLVGKNIIKKIANGDVIKGLSMKSSTSIFFDMPNSVYNDTTPGILSNSGYTISDSISSRLACFGLHISSVNALDFMKDYITHNFGIMYGNRQNVIIFKYINNNILETLSKSELINDAQYKKMDKINTLVRIMPKRAGGISYNESSSPSVIFEETFTLEKSEQIFLVSKYYGGFVVDSHLVNFTYEGATSATIKFETTYLAIIKVNGNVGSSVTLKAVTNNSQLDSGESEYITKITNKTNGEKEIALELKSALNNFPGTFTSSLGQLEYAPSYEMSFEYNGDPSLEAGDYINVETPYGYKPLFIQKNRFKFDGGLSGSIEGVE